MKTYNNFLNEVLLNPEYKEKSNGMTIISYKKYIYYLDDKRMEEPEYLQKLSTDLGLEKYYDIMETIREELPSAIILTYYEGKDILYLYRSSSYFSFDYNLSHHFIETLKTLKKELGVKYIDIGENYMVGENEFDKTECIGIDILISNFTKDLKVKKLPETIYHGTCTKHISKILKLGLIPKSGQSNFKKLYHENDYVYLSSEIIDSVFYAGNSAELTKSFPIILEIDANCIDKDNVDFDYDFYIEFIGVGNEYFDELYNRESRPYVKSNLLKELKDKYIGATYRKFSYKKRIPPKYIKKIYYNSGDNDFSEYYGDGEFDDFLEMISYVEDFGYEHLVDPQTLEEFKQYEEDNED